jgi:hypothetical protein
MMNTTTAWAKLPHAKPTLIHRIEWGAGAALSFVRYLWRYLRTGEIQ